MCARRPVATVSSARSFVAACLGGFLLVAVAAAGCTPDSSGSPSAPDSTTGTAQTASSSTEGAPVASSAAAPETDTSPETDASRSVAQHLADASVAARVKQALVRTRSLRRFDFFPTVVRGRLTLRGDVDTQQQYRQAERVASNVEGVTAVTNQVTVQGRPVSEAGSPEDVTYHTVRPGDTLWQIAEAYGVSVRRLRALNDLSGALQPGQRIRVR